MDAGEGTEWRAAWPSRLATAVTAVIVAVPMVAGAIGRARERWVPDLDDAAITHRVQRVLQLHPTLVGMPSTLQGDVIGPSLTTNHPGPLLFWLLAPAYALTGQAGIGIAIGAAIVNLVAAVTAVVFAHRRRGPALAAVVGIGLLLLERSLSTDLLASPFNPYLSIIPLLCLVVLTWSVAAGDRAGYVPFVLAASLVAQAHLSGVIPAAALFVVGAAGALVAEGVVPEPHRPLLRRPARPRRGRHLGAAGAVLGLVWLPVLVDEAFGSHNLSHLWSATHGRGAPVGWSFAATAVGRALGLPAAFAMGQHRGTAYAIALPTASVVLALVVIAAALAWAAHRRWWGELGFVGAALVALLCCAVQTSRLPASTIDPSPFAFTVWHVRYWMLPLGAAAWSGVAWIGARSVAMVARPRLRAVSAWVAVAPVACLLVAVVLPARPAVWRAGERQQSAIVRHLADQAAHHLRHDRTYLAQVTVYDASTFGGVMAELWSRGFHLVVPQDTAYYWGPGSRCRAAAVDGVLQFRSGAAVTNPVGRGSQQIARTQG
ncbi:MAG TPA: hypothetical protein VGM93_05400, partial [Acidimicrobiales bacterium]